MRCYTFALHSTIVCFMAQFSILHMINSIFSTMCVYRYLVVNFHPFFFRSHNLFQNPIFHRCVIITMYVLYILVICCKLNKIKNQKSNSRALWYDYLNVVYIIYEDMILICHNRTENRWRYNWLQTHFTVQNIKRKTSSIRMTLRNAIIIFHLFQTE